mmetsp:Transcript_14562/g.31661  ORF Transcript_14562/g.31661 Transcript_14562/m.31661 type:complete len:211 (+) Transcript_14562:538-1170(+)
MWRKKRYRQQKCPRSQKIKTIRCKAYPPIALDDLPGGIDADIPTRTRSATAINFPRKKNHPGAYPSIAAPLVFVERDPSVPLSPRPSRTHASLESSSGCPPHSLVAVSVVQSKTKSAEEVCPLAADILARTSPVTAITLPSKESHKENYPSIATLPPPRACRAHAVFANYPNRGIVAARPIRKCRGLCVPHDILRIILLAWSHLLPLLRS